MGFSFIAINCIANSSLPLARLHLQGSAMSTGAHILVRAKEADLRWSGSSTA